MDAFHSFWSKPNAIKNRGKINIPDYELLTMILSALEWKSTNGSIKIITDSQGAEFFESNGIYNLWDEIDTSLDYIASDIDPFLFWAAGKLYAFKIISCPYVMLDTDLIIWKNIDCLLNYDIVAAHYEELMPDVYPDIRTFKMKESYQFPKEWNFNIKAINTAFLFIKENSFRDYYIKCAEEFMHGIIMDNNFNPITAMCFAEQRILGMCTEAKGLQVNYLLQLKNAEQQDFITHIWGYKRKLNSSYKHKINFGIQCIKRIIEDFPEYEHIIANNRKFSIYYKEYQAYIN